MSFRAIAWSSVGKKLITGITGFALIGFLIGHLLGNLTLFIGPEAFNHYAHFLEELLHGWFIIAFEVVMIAIIVCHILAAATVAVLDKNRARPVAYKKLGRAGHTSRKTLSSVSMIISGLIIFGFLIWHIKTMKYGNPPIIAIEGGGTMKDLHAVVMRNFEQLWVVVAYVAVMILVGLHLRHGFWSAFQSMGWTNDRTLPTLERLSLIAGVLFAIGFMILPLVLHFTGGVGGGHADLTGGF
jgi:succinate dehydrogenase / fumarate reductase cytochrome b subunit